MSTFPIKDYYAVLGVPRDASRDDIARSFRSLAMQCHPDRHPHDKGAEDRFKAINEAHEILTDRESRSIIDKHLSGALRGTIEYPADGPARGTGGARRSRRSPDAGMPLVDAQGFPLAWTLDTILIDDFLRRKVMGLPEMVFYVPTEESISEVYDGLAFLVDARVTNYLYEVNKVVGSSSQYLSVVKARGMEALLGTVENCLIGGGLSATVTVAITSPMVTAGVVGLGCAGAYMLASWHKANANERWSDALIRCKEECKPKISRLADLCREELEKYRRI